MSEIKTWRHKCKCGKCGNAFEMQLRFADAPPVDSIWSPCCQVECKVMEREYVPLPTATKA